MYTTTTTTTTAEQLLELYNETVNGLSESAAAVTPVAPQIDTDQAQRTAEFETLLRPIITAVRGSGLPLPLLDKILKENGFERI